MISDLFSCLLFVGYLFVLSIVSFETQNGELENQFVFFFFPLCLCFGCWVHCWLQCHEDLSPGFLLSVLWLLFLHWDVDPFCVVLYMVWGVGFHPHASTGGSPAVPAPLVKGTVLSHWLDFGILVSSQRAMAGCICSLSSIPMCSPLREDHSAWFW